MDSSKAIEGVFLEFTREELQEIYEVLERFDYTPDSKGLKEYILEDMFGEDDEEPSRPDTTDGFIKKAQTFVAENPATVKLAFDTLSKIAGSFKKRK